MHLDSGSEREWGFDPLSDENHKRTMDHDHSMIIELNQSGISDTKEAMSSLEIFTTCFCSFLH